MWRGCKANNNWGHTSQLLFLRNRCSEIDSGAFWGYPARLSFILVVKEGGGGGGGGGWGRC